MAITFPRGGGSGNVSRLPNDPTARLGWEINAHDTWWSFVPHYYPDRFTQTKERDLNRDGRQCAGEDVSLKAIKNREFHATGIVLAAEIPVYQKLMDFDGKVDVISPLTPSGGMECQIKNGELGQKVGWDPIHQQLQFEYTIDFVSTGRDEYDRDNNAIVSEITETNVRTNMTAEERGILAGDTAE